MEILLASLAILGWCCGTISIAIAMYSHYKYQSMISQVQIEASGIERRLEHFIEKATAQHALELRQSINNETMELLQSMLGNAPADTDYLGMANFSKWNK